MTKIVKRKATGFFRPEQLKVIKQAVHDHHVIISETSLLIKNYYLQWIQSKNFNDLNNVVNVEINKDLFHISSLVVQGNQYSSRGGEKSKENNERYVHLKKVFNDVYGPTHKCFSSKLSLSQILSYGLKNLETVYENNIQSHYLKYCKKYIKCCLLEKGVKLAEAKEAAYFISLFYMYENLVVENEKMKKPLINDNLLLFSYLFPQKHSDKPLCYEMEVNPSKFLPFMVKMNCDFENSFPDVDEKHKKLMNPFPLHSSFIQMHARFDTSGLAQLLMDIDKIKDFSNLYDIEHGYKPQIKNKIDLLSKSSKLFPHKQLSQEEEHQYATEIWNYLTNLKTCRQGKEIFHTIKKTKTEFVFDNAIVTDGTSISFQVVEKQKMKRKCKKEMDQANWEERERKKREKAKAKEEKQKKKEDRIKEQTKVKEEKIKEQENNENNENKETQKSNTVKKKKCECKSCEDCLIKEKKEREKKEKKDKIDDLLKKKVIGNDPGKKDILALTDGITTLCYTRSQRNIDTQLQKRLRKTLRLRECENIDVFESECLSQTPKKSCQYEVFKAYCRQRDENREKLKKVYDAPHFQQSKFFVHAKTKSSEMKFFNKIESVFSKPNQLLETSNNTSNDTCNDKSNHSSNHKNKLKYRRCIEKHDCMKNNIRKNATHKKDFIIAYGNGGQGMNNLKGMQSCPNVTIRRHLESYFNVFSQNEHYTSKTCPCCNERSLDCFNKTKFDETKEKNITYHKHHLLRCTNVNCESRWWNRNVVGSFNILKRFLNEQFNFKSLRSLTNGVMKTSS